MSLKMASQRRSINTLICLLAVAAILLVFWKIYSAVTDTGKGLFPFPQPNQKRHVYDEAGILSAFDIGKFEEYLNYVYNESDIDIRFLFVKGTGLETIENLAVKRMQDLGVGKENREERGLLVLFDVSGRQLRIEVGYGLEAYLPDAFVGYLVRDHAKDFFAEGDLTKGLRLFIRMLHHRIRERILGREFNPRIIEMIRQKGNLSGGAGVSGVMPSGNSGASPGKKKERSESNLSFQPQLTPEAVYMKYIEWLVAGVYDPRINIFTEESQRYLSALPMTKAYFHFILMQEHRRKYIVFTRDHVALLCFTDDPLVSPHFFIKSEKGWQMDMIAEVNNTRNRVGGIFTWDYAGQNDIYTKTFLDKLVNIKNYIRLTDGDNRELPIRSSR